MSETIHKKVTIGRTTYVLVKQRQKGLDACTGCVGHPSTGTVPCLSFPNDCGETNEVWVKDDNEHPIHRDCLHKKHLSDHVRVRLTEAGKRIFNGYTTINQDRKALNLIGEDILEVSLYTLFCIFGPHLEMFHNDDFFEHNHIDFI